MDFILMSCSHNTELLHITNINTKEEYRVPPETIHTSTSLRSRTFSSATSCSCWRHWATSSCSIRRDPCSSSRRLSTITTNQHKHILDTMNTERAEPVINAPLQPHLLRVVQRFQSPCVEKDDVTTFGWLITLRIKPVWLMADFITNILIK